SPRDLQRRWRLPRWHRLRRGGHIGNPPPVPPPVLSPPTLWGWRVSAQLRIQSLVTPPLPTVATPACLHAHATRHQLSPPAAEWRHCSPVGGAVVSLGAWSELACTGNQRGRHVKIQEFAVLMTAAVLHCTKIVASVPGLPWHQCKSDRRVQAPRMPVARVA